ncbi:hypothetical protein Ddc_20183 [Ditylenchus destructor]|nr:hypothetical protein Ddc_20183 [Ditylenchus destructor]
MQNHVSMMGGRKRAGKKPTAFKALCFHNTGFMVDFLGFFTRDDFEKYLQLTCARMNQLVLRHFSSKPYRCLEDVTLECDLDCDMQLCLSKPANIRFSTFCWDPYKLQWENFRVMDVEFPAMLPFLNKTVRVPKVKIWIGDCTIMTQENIDKLKSLSHTWENAQVDFTTDRYLKENLMSRAELLNTAKLFRCRRFKSSFKDVMLPLWDYPEIYSMEAVEINFTPNKRLGYEFDDWMPIIKLVENRPLHPQSQTTFVFSEDKDRYQPFITNNVIQHICDKFTESDKAQSFQIIFAVREKYISDSEMDEFRLENNRTQEVLHLRRVTHSEVSKYCEFYWSTKYFVLERSLI